MCIVYFKLFVSFKLKKIKQNGIWNAFAEQDGDNPTQETLNA